MENITSLAALGVGLGMIVGATLLGYFLQQGCGIVLFAGGATLAFGLCLAGAALGGWLGLLAAVLIVGLLGAFVGRKLGGSRAARLIGLLWFGFCLSYLIGYWVGAEFGLMAITLPANILFWVALYLFSGFLLPLKNGDQRNLAFRSLLTFSLGSNFPYLVQNGRRLEERVAGNPYKSMLGGPGVIITDSEHVAVITNGNNIEVTNEPGLLFTQRFEVPHCLVDLRPQLRAFDVDAHTLDGIPIRVLAFIPFRIHRGGQAPELGKPFPFQKRALLRALTGEVIEPLQDCKHDWDELVEIHATRIMRDIISRYKVDDLCLAQGPAVAGEDSIVTRYQADEKPDAHDPQQDPRLKIRNEMVSRTKKAVQRFGIEVMGGGISNLMPLDQEVIDRRIENWRKKWQHRITLTQAAGDAKKVEAIGQARATAEQKMQITIARLLKEGIDDGQDMSDELLVATLVTTLEQMAENPNVKELLPDETRQKLTYLRRFGRPLLT